MWKMPESRGEVVIDDQKSFQKRLIESVLLPIQKSWPWGDCPLCGATVSMRAKETHINWHLRNLQ